MTTTGRTHQLSRDTIHHRWDRSIPPALEIEPGDTVLFETRDATDHQLTPQSTAADLAALDFNRIHALTGPVFVKGARPGDALAVTILDMKPAAWGWSAILPGLGLLSEDFPDPYLKIWDLSNGETAELRPGIAIPFEPHPGIMGVALDEPGEFPTLPPRKNGGNIDIKQLTIGATLYMPVWVEGALFSCGDCHFAQGDGEVCVTGIEADFDVTLRFDLRRDLRLRELQFHTGGPLSRRTNTGGYWGATAHADDLMVASKNAVRHMIEHLVDRHGLTPEEAYILCSVAADLRISEVVDTPNWIVSALLPDAVFRR